MSAVTKRAIHRELSRLRAQDFQDLLHHDRPMRAGRSLSARQNFRDILGVTRGIVLLVFLLETARVFARISDASFVRGWRFFAHWMGI